MTEFQQAYANLCAKLGDLTIKKKQLDSQVLHTEQEIATLLSLAAKQQETQNEQQTKGT